MTNPAVISVEGGPELTRTLGRAADEFNDMTRPGDRAGDLIANRGRVVVPRLTGALSHSITTNVDANRVEITSALPYANRTHWGYARYDQRAQPFLWEPATQQMNTWVSYYGDEADRILHTVKGA